MASNNQIFLKISVDGKDSINVIRDLEIKLKEARKEFENLNLAGSNTSKTEQQIKKLSAELNQLKSNGGGASVNALRKEVRLLDLELGTLTDGTAEYAAKLQELANKKDQLGDLQNAIKALNPEERIKAFASLGAGVVGAFTAAQSAVALFGSENEQVELAIQKVVAGLGILQGVQAVVSQKDNIAIVARILGYRSLTSQIAATTAGQTALGGATNATSFSFANLRAILLSLGIGALVVGIGLLIANWDKLKESLSGVSVAQKQINDLRVSAAKTAAEEQSKVKLLVDEYQTANTSQLRRKEIIEELNQISPNYFGNLNKEKTNINDLVGAYDKWSKAILLKSQVDAIAQKISENNVKIAEINSQEIGEQVSVFETLLNTVTSVGNITSLASKQINTGLENKKESIDKITESNKILQEELNKTFTQLNQAGGDTSIDSKKDSEENKKKADELQKAADKRKAEAIKKEDDLFQTIINRQKLVEEQTKLSYDRQKADAEKFFEEKKNILLQEQITVQSDTTITESEKVIKQRVIDNQLVELKKSFQKEINSIEKSSFETSLQQNEEFKNEQLKFNETSIKSVTEKEKKKNEIIGSFTKERVETENEIVKQGTEVQAQANDELAQKIKDNAQLIKDSNDELYTQQQAFVASLTELYNGLATAIVSSLQQAGEAQKAQIDSNLENTVTNINKNKEEEIAIIQNQYDLGLIQKEEFEKKKTAIETNYSSQSISAKQKSEDEKKKIDRKTAEIKKIFEIGNIGIDLAKSLAKIQLTVTELAALTALFPAYALPLAFAQAQIPIAIGVAGLQIAAISSQKFATGGVAGSNTNSTSNSSKSNIKFITDSTLIKEIVELERAGFALGGVTNTKYKPGGIIKEGTTGTADDVPIVVSRGETIINAKSSSLFKDELSAINNYNNYGVKFSNNKPSFKGMSLAFAEGGIAGSLINNYSTSNNNNSNTNSNSVITNNSTKRTEQLLEELVSKSEDNININKKILNTEYKARVVASEVTEEQRIDKLLIEKGTL